MNADRRSWLAGLLAYSFVVGACELELERGKTKESPRARIVHTPVSPPPDLGSSVQPEPAAPQNPAPPASIETEAAVEVVLTDMPSTWHFAVTPHHYYASIESGVLLRVDRWSGKRTTLDDDSSSERLWLDDSALYAASLSGVLRIEHDSDTPIRLVDVEAVEELDGVLGLALDDHFVYLTPFQNPGIFRVPKAGGTLEQISTQPRPGDIVVTETHIYFASFFRNRIGRLPKAGGRTQSIVAHAAGPVALALEDTTAVALLETSGEVIAVDTNTRAHRRLADAGQNPQAVAIAGGRAYFSTGSIGPDDPTFIRRVALEGGPPQTLVQSEDALSLLAVDDGWLYFSVAEADMILRLRAEY
ncbi:MAG: hypothetical protein ACRBN8_33980 [Nannocystales bacterium]